MAEIKNVNILDAISQFKNYHTSVILTYGANLAFYEQGVLHRIWQADCRNNLIFMDADRYFETIPEFSDTLGYIGRRYLVVPIKVGPFQAFHSKIILLLGSDKARLLIGSGNLTFNGYGDNLEIFTQIDWSNDARDYQRVLSDAWNIIIEIQKRWGHFEQADAMLEKAERQSEWLHEDSPIADVQIISSLNAPLLDQLSGCVGKQKIERITILSPFLDSKSKAIEKLNRTFTPKNMDLVLQNNKTNGDIKSLNKLQSTGVPLNFYIFEEERYIHAKLYAIEGKKESILAIGSANCTQAGLLANSDKANMETLIIHKYQTKDRFQKILSNFISSQKIELADTMILRPNITVGEKEKNTINFQDIVLDGQTLVAKFIIRLLPSKIDKLVLQFSMSKNLTFPIEQHNIGDNSVKLSITNLEAQLLNNSICAASICGVETKSKNNVPISNSLWLTNIGELNRRQIFLTPNDERAGQLLSEMHLGSDEDWRDLYNTISTLVEFELEKIKSYFPETSTEKGKRSKKDSKNTEQESILRIIDRVEEDAFGISAAESETIKESTLNSWLGIVFSQFPGEQKSESNAIQKSAAVKQQRHLSFSHAPIFW